MNRKRLLEIILAVVCVVCIPGYLVNLYLSRLNAASAPKAPATDPRFKAAFDAGVALEQRQQYQEAIFKFLEAEMYAGKIQNGQYAALESAIEHYRSRNDALGQQAEVHAAPNNLYERSSKKENPCAMPASSNRPCQNFNKLRKALKTLTTSRCRWWTWPGNGSQKSSRYSNGIPTRTRCSIA
jgi:hypothetical protein